MQMSGNASRRHQIRATEWREPVAGVEPEPHRDQQKHPGERHRADVQERERDQQRGSTAYRRASGA